MLAMLLRGRNIDCDIADNGLEALSLIKSSGQTYDFVFMDFTMPVMVSEQPSPFSSLQLTPL